MIVVVVGVVGATIVSPTDLKFSFVYKRKPVFSRLFEIFAFDHVLMSEKPYECWFPCGLLWVSVFIRFSFFGGWVLFERDHQQLRRIK